MRPPSGSTGRRGCVTAWLLLHGLRHLAGFVVAAGAVGTAAGVGAYLLGPTIAAAVSGMSGFVAALAVQLALWLRQTLLAWTAGGPQKLADRKRPTTAHSRCGPTAARIAVAASTSPA